MGGNDKNITDSEEEEDDDDDEFGEFSVADHVRSSLLSDMPMSLQTSGFVPSNESEGMLLLHHQHGIGRTSGSTRRLLASTVSKKSVTHVPSASFRRGESETIQKVLEDVDRIASKRMKEGMNEVNFTLGVLNSFFVCYVFGRFPQHFWLLYSLEMVILVPAKFYYMWRAKPLNESLFYLDLCYFLNFVGMLALAIFAVLRALDITVSPLAPLRKHVFLAAMGAACGPLLGASILLPFVSFLFHDVRTMTGLFIHILPPMVAYSFMWHVEEIQEAWPMFFRLNYLEDVRFFPESGPFFIPGIGGLGTVAGNGIALYIGWFIAYVLWMIVIGFDLPRTVRRWKDKNGNPLPTRYDTVFHSTVRGGLCITFGKVFWNRPKEVSLQQMETNDYEWRDFAVYMTIHAILAILSIYALAYPCYANKNVHLSLLVFLFVICVHRGSQRYTYYSTTMYGRLIRKRFEEQIDKLENAATKKKQ